MIKQIQYLSILILSLFHLAEINCQQAFIVSNFHLDKYDINPAYGGMEDQLILTARYRNQWQGLAGNPELLRLSAHAPLYAINGGVGALLRTQRIGLESNSDIQFSYNQVFPFSFALLSVGVRSGFTNKSLNGEGLISENGDYETGDNEHNDNYIPRGRVSALAPVWGISFYYYSKFADFGIVFDDYPIIAVDLEGIQIQKRQAITIHGNYFLNLSGNLKMEAFALLRSDFIQLQAEYGFLTKYRDGYFISMQLRGYDKQTLDAFGIGIGAKVNNNLILAYNYEMGISPLRQVSNGTHEFLIKYQVNASFGKKIPETIIHHPRFYE